MPIIIRIEVSSPKSQPWISRPTRGVKLQGKPMSSAEIVLRQMLKIR